MTGPRCERHAGEPYVGRCSDCDRTAAEANAQSVDAAPAGELEPIAAADFKWLTFAADGMLTPLDEHDFNERGLALLQAFANAVHPSDCRTPIFELRRATESAAYTALIVEKAVRFWVRWALMDSPLRDLVLFERNFRSVATTYRAIAPHRPGEARGLYFGVSEGDHHV